MLIENFRAMDVLFLEDSVLDYELICEQLNDAGIAINPTHVLNLASFHQAISKQNFDIVISDYQLPDCTAFDALNLRNVFIPDTPFICVSGSIGEELAIELLKKGAEDYVLKDRMTRLPFAIQRAMEESNVRAIRRQTQLALEKSEARFRNLFQNHVAAKLLIEPVSGNIVEANDSAVELMGESREVLLRMNWTQLARASSIEVELIQKSITELGKFHFESRYTRSDGANVDIEVFASLIQIEDEQAIHAIIHDITEKKKTEDEIRLFKKAVESSSISISISDIQGNLLYVNPYFTRITGYSYDEVMGKNPRFLKSGLHPSTYYKEMWDTILSGKDWEGEFQNKRKNGELFWVKAIISPILNRDGSIAHFVAVKDDVTDQRRLLSELLKAKNKAEESDRLKTAFLHNLSHEIRTPMNAIIGFGQFLANEELTVQQRKEYFEILDHSSKRLMNTVDDLVEMASLLSGVIQLTKNTVFIAELFTELKFKFDSQCRDKQLSLKLELSGPDENIIHTDEKLLKRILEELVDNAVKFTSEGSVTIGCLQKNDLLELFVKDTGIGINMINYDMIFHPFNQENVSIARLFEGNGLGLSIARGYARLLGTDISIESESGKGSTFSFKLPVHN